MQQLVARCDLLKFEYLCSISNNLILAKYLFIRKLRRNLVIKKVLSK